MMKKIKTTNSNDSIYHYHQYENKDQIFLVVRCLETNQNFLVVRCLGKFMGVKWYGMNQICLVDWNQLASKTLMKSNENIC